MHDQLGNGHSGAEQPRTVVDPADVSTLNSGPQSVSTETMSGVLDTVVRENQIVQVRLGVASSLFAALRWRHADTASHALRVTLNCSGWSLLHGVSDAQRDALELAALLHDLGKIGVPDSILLKPGELTPDEMAIMDRHRSMGLEVLESSCASESVLDIIRYGANWFDGTKCTGQIFGSELPLGARMLAIADAFDAMTSDHVYRRAMSRERALSELFRCAGSQFDPNLVEEFSDLQEQHGHRLGNVAMSRWLQSLEEARPQDQWQLNLARSNEPADHSHALFQQKLVDNMQDAVIFVDASLRVLRWNLGAERLTGIPASGIHQRRWTPKLLEMCDDSGEPLSDSDCPVDYALRSGVQLLRRIMIRDRHGRFVAVDAHVIPVVCGNGTTHGATVVLHDVSSEISLEVRCQSLLQRATVDPLTQVANRAEFDRFHGLFVEAHLERNLPCGMIITDIDHFKQVNDTYGHQAGDEVLRVFGKLLKSSCRAGDLVARYGGEEFVILCADCDNAAATRRADEIREAFARTSIRAVYGNPVTASFGVTQIQAGDTPETILRRADRALFRAKESGRNCAVQLGAGLSDDAVNDAGADPPSPDSAPDAVAETRLITCEPVRLTINKLRGFIDDQQADIVDIEGDRIHIKISTAGASGLFRRSADRQVAIHMEMVFEEEIRPEGDQNVVPKTRAHVSVRVPSERDRRRSGVADLARHLLHSLKAYLMAVDDPAASDGTRWRRAKDFFRSWLAE